MKTSQMKPSRLVMALLAAGAIGGAFRQAASAAPDDGRPALGITMFGVTTPCVQQVVPLLESRYDCLVFHATGTGGQSMEKLLDSHLLAGVLDLTTTEVCDLLFGGVLACTEDRFGAVARTGAPYVGSCGALDMVNFGAMETVPERYRGRKFYPYNPQVTLMRTTVEENARQGEWIAFEKESRPLVQAGRNGLCVGLNLTVEALRVLAEMADCGLYAGRGAEYEH